MKDFANRGSRRRRRRTGAPWAAADEGASESFFHSTGRAGKRDHKTAQLCRQVFRALSLALAECGDDVLRELVVHAVDPAPDASRLLVQVGFSSAAPRDMGAAEVHARLGDAGRFLRREAAAAITRKRAPELMFTLVAPGAGAGGGEVSR